MASHLYFAVFRAETGGGYSVTFPDVPGVVTEGDDFGDALQNAKDALETALDFLVAEGRPLPSSRPPEQLIQEVHGAPIAAVEAETASNSVRVNVSFDERLLVRIDRAAEQSGQTRSGFLARAARELISGRSRGADLRVVSQHGAPEKGALDSTRSAFDQPKILRDLAVAYLGVDRAALWATTNIPSQDLHGSGDEVCGPFYTLRSTAEALNLMPAGSNFTTHEVDEEEFRHS